MRWMWIDTIVDYEPDARMVALKNVSLSEEHLHDHFPGTPVMPAALMIEGMAQTAGILVGAVNRFREKVVLAKITLARFDADVFAGHTIRYDARIDRMDQAGAATTGTVERLDHAPTGDPTWRPIGAVNLMFSHIDRNLAGLDFPEENFVFSDNFRTILRTAGLSDLADA